jgi:hypothetical protein
MKKRTSMTWSSQWFDVGNRQSYLESFRPPDGYTLDSAIITTYSIDLDVATAVLCTMVRPGEINREMLTTEKPTDGSDSYWRQRLIGHIRRLQKRVRIFYNANRIHCPSVNPLNDLLSWMLVPVLNTQGRSFHPKCSVLKFKRTDESAKLDPFVIRLLCSSRNMTSERMWEIMFAVDGTMRKKGSSQAKEVAEFVGRLRRISGETVEKGSDCFSSILEDLENVVFGDAQSATSEWSAHFFGQGKPTHLITQNQKPKRLLVMSPFVDLPGLNLLVGGTKMPRRNKKSLLTGREDVLITRSDQTARMEKTKISKKAGQFNVKRVFAFKFRPLSEPEGQNERTPTDLHAKLYIVEESNQSHVWIGSANATQRGWGGRNVEAMVRLTIRGKGLIDYLLESLKAHLADVSPSENDVETPALWADAVVDYLQNGNFAGYWDKDSATVTIKFTPPKGRPEQYEWPRGAGRIQILLPLLGEKHPLKREIGIPANSRPATMYFVWTLDVSDCIPSTVVSFLIIPETEGERRRSFAVQLQLEGRSADDGLQAWRKEMPKGFEYDLLWEIAGRTAGMSRPGGRGLSKGKGNGTKRVSIKSALLPPIERIIHACVADPKNTPSELQGLIEHMSGDEEVEYYVKTLKLILNATKPQIDNDIFQTSRET